MHVILYVKTMSINHQHILLRELTFSVCMLLLCPGQIQRQLQLRIEEQGQNLQKMIEAQAQAGLAFGYRSDLHNPAESSAQTTITTDRDAATIKGIQPSQGALLGLQTSSQVDLVAAATTASTSSPPREAKRARVEVPNLVIIPQESVSLYASADLNMSSSTRCIHHNNNTATTTAAAATTTNSSVEGPLEPGSSSPAAAANSNTQMNPPPAWKPSQGCVPQQSGNTAPTSVQASV